MSKTALSVLSVIEVVALVAVLGGFLLAVAGVLRRIVTTLAEITFGARAVERQLRAVPHNIRETNRGLGDAAVVLPGLSNAVDRKTGRATR